MTGVTVGPGGMVVAAGASRSPAFPAAGREASAASRPGGAGRQRRPRASASTASARPRRPGRGWPGRGWPGRWGTRGLVARARRPVGAGGGRGATVLAGHGARADQRRSRRRGLARGRAARRPGRDGRPAGRGRNPGLGHRPRQPAADPHDLTGRAGLAPGRGCRAAGGAGLHPGRGRGGAVRLRGGRCAGRRRPADGRAVVVGQPHHLGTAGMVDADPRAAASRPRCWR